MFAENSKKTFRAAGDMELNILIRTIIKTPRLAEFYAGAGIVADSNPLREYRETSHKARALAEALGVKLLDKGREA